MHAIPLAAGQADVMADHRCAATAADMRRLGTEDGHFLAQRSAKLLVANQRQTQDIVQRNMREIEAAIGQLRRAGLGKSSSAFTGRPFIARSVGRSRSSATWRTSASSLAEPQASPPTGKRGSSGVGSGWGGLRVSGSRIPVCEFLADSLVERTRIMHHPAASSWSA